MNLLEFVEHCPEHFLSAATSVCAFTCPCSCGQAIIQSLKEKMIWKTFS